MNEDPGEIAFGPVPSRRLGLSLGVNNIPPKTCSYSCRYCQVGRTRRLRCTRESFHDPMEIVKAVHRRIEAVRRAGERIDTVTFIAEGEPTLDLGLGLKIELLKRLGYPVAVVTNASLLCKKDVRQDLAKADLVSLKIDAAEESIWKALNRPHGSLRFPEILEGLREFAASYPGRLMTETLLVAGLNDDPRQVRETAGVIASLGPAKAYLCAPTRPPAEESVQAPNAAVLGACRDAFAETLPQAELLFAPAAGAFFCGRDAEAGILGIAAVHPLREADLRNLAAWSIVEKLMAEGRLVATDFNGVKFYAKGEKA